MTAYVRNRPKFKFSKSLKSNLHPCLEVVMRSCASKANVAPVKICGNVNCIELNRDCMKILTIFFGSL